MQYQSFSSLAQPGRSTTTDSWPCMKLSPKQMNSFRSRFYRRCHGKRYRRIRIVPFKSIIGSLAFVYSGFTLARQHCDISSCHNFRTCMVEVTYCFPRLAFNIAITGGLMMDHGWPTAGVAVKPRITKDMQRMSILEVARFRTVAELRPFLQTIRALCME